MIPRQTIGWGQRLDAPIALLIVVGSVRAIQRKCKRWRKAEALPSLTLPVGTGTFFR